MSKIFEIFRRVFGAPTSSRTGQGNEREQLVDEEALEFFNSLSATLEIELTQPAQPIGGLLNVAAPAGAAVVSVFLRAKVSDDSGEGRPLAESELQRVVFETSQIRLQGESGEVVTHKAPESGEFTVDALLKAVEETERRTRGATDWLGGVDVHHCYFEGIHETREGVWEIYWGS